MDEDRYLGGTKNELKSNSQVNKRAKKKEKIVETQTKRLNTSRMSHATGMDSHVGERNWLI